MGLLYGHHDLSINVSSNGLPSLGGAEVKNSYDEIVTRIFLKYR